MATLYTQKRKNVQKTWFLVTVFLLVVIGLGWFFSWYYQSPAILIGAVIFSVVMNVIAYWYSDKIVLRIHRAHPVTRESHFELWNITENLSITAGLPMPRLYVIDEDVPNAFATGRDENHAVVAVTSGLLRILDRNELEGVIAHELSHIGNKDMLISTVVVVLVGFISLLSDIFLRVQLFGGGRNREGAGAAFAILGIVLAILSPLVGLLIQAAVSRKREYLADASGALLTRYPDGLARALEKISSHSGKMRQVNHATAHLFIANPFGPKEAVQGINKLFATHPPVEKRVEALRGM